MTTSARAGRGRGHRPRTRWSASGSPPRAPTTRSTSSLPASPSSYSIQVPRSRDRRSTRPASTGSACTRSARTTRAATRSPTVGPAPSCRWSRRHGPAGRHRPGDPDPPPDPARRRRQHRRRPELDPVAVPGRRAARPGRPRRRGRLPAGHLAGRPGRHRRRAPAGRRQPAALAGPDDRPTRTTTTATSRSRPSPSASPTDGDGEGEEEPEVELEPRGRWPRPRPASAGSTGCTTGSRTARSWPCRTATWTSPPPPPTTRRPTARRASAPSGDLQPWGLATTPAVVLADRLPRRRRDRADRAGRHACSSPTGCSARQPAVGRAHRRSHPGGHLLGGGQRRPRPERPAVAAGRPAADRQRGRGPGADAGRASRCSWSSRRPGARRR